MATVLVAEDEQDIQLLYTAWQHREGYQVTTADNGVEAISAFERSEFDIVILDVMMPEVDGLEVCRHIRARNPHVPILMVSALARPDDVEHGLQAGASLDVETPVTPREAILRINEVLTAARDRPARPSRWDRESGASFWELWASLRIGAQGPAGALGSPGATSGRRLRERCATIATVRSRSSRPGGWGEPELSTVN